jgi:hypothetical protein
VVIVTRQESFRVPRSRQRRVADLAAVASVDQRSHPGRRRELRAAIARLSDGCEQLLRLLADVPADTIVVGSPQPGSSRPASTGSGSTGPGSSRHLGRLLELLDVGAGQVAGVAPAAGPLKDGRR